MNNSAIVNLHSRNVILFGIQPMLKVLELYEKAEDYNECGLIIKGIEKAEKELRTTFPRRLSECEKMNRLQLGHRANNIISIMRHERFLSLMRKQNGRTKQQYW